MDLEMVAKKNQDKSYKTITEFMLDVSWIQHNCLIVGTHYALQLSIPSAFVVIRFPLIIIYHLFHSIDRSKKKQKITKRLIDFCAQEVAAIDACNECYIQANIKKNIDWFSTVCSRKHPIVWGKVVGHPYQPAKVMKVHHDNVDLYFFGDHKSATIPVKACLGFSQKSPNKALSSFNATKIANAIKVCHFWLLSYFIIHYH